MAKPFSVCGCGLGFKSTCRPCITLRTYAARDAKIEQYKAASAAYEAAHPESQRERSRRWKAKAKTQERACYKCGTVAICGSGYCPPCDKAYKAAWHQANKLKNKPSNANPETRRKNKLIAEQRRRARKRATPDEVSLDIVAKLLALQKGQCACCKVKFIDGKHELDHIEALANGGRHADDNLQLLCMRCNRTKADKDPIRFMQELGYLL